MEIIEYKKQKKFFQKRYIELRDKYLVFKRELVDLAFQLKEEDNPAWVDLQNILDAFEEK